MFSVFRCTYRYPCALTSYFTSCSTQKNLHILHSQSDYKQGDIERLKYPSHGGQNLSERYARLERTIRGKEEYTHDIENYEKMGSVSGQSDNVIRNLKAPVMYRGFVVPEEPISPQDDECCMSGCAICVYDLYQESLEAYKAAVVTLRNNLTALNIPESEWPKQIQLNVEKQKQNSQPNDVALSAFEKMELELAARRRDTQAHAPASKPVSAGDVLEALSWVVFSRR